MNPDEVAEQIKESQAYIAKVLRQLTQGGLLRSRRGVAGGFELAQPPAAISLLDVVQICQGTIPGNYCGRTEVTDIRKTCGYHQAMHDLQESTRGALARWTIAKILTKPAPKGALPSCIMRRVTGRK